jgi:putative transposase
MNLDDREQPVRFLIHDRDAKFSGGFDQVFTSEGVTVIRTPVRAPNANAHAERWVGSARRQCLDRLLIFSRRENGVVFARARLRREPNFEPRPVSQRAEGEI